MNTNEQFQGSRYVFFQQFYWEKSKQDTLWRWHFWAHPSPPLCKCYVNLSDLVTPSVPKRTLKGNKKQNPPQNGPFLEVEIMCMYFILSDPFTYLHIWNPLLCRHFLKALYPLWKICNIIVRKWGRGGQRLFGIFPKIHPFWYPDPGISNSQPSSLVITQSDNDCCKNFDLNLFSSKWGTY